jgi:hypothetical protein
MRRTASILLLTSLLSPLAPLAAQSVDLEMVSRIREEGLRHSQALEVAEYLTDVIGPRLTGSPSLKQANEWTRKKLEEWGLSNAHLEGYEFGRGWTFSRSAVHMVKPQATPILALPKAWTPGTNGPVRAQVMRVDIKSDADFDKYRGKLAGKILLVDDAKDLAYAEVEPRRFTDQQLDDLVPYEIPSDPQDRKEAMRRWNFRKPLIDFLTQEKALATVEPSARGWGIVRVGRGGSYKPGENTGPLALVMAAEPYNRIVRLLDKGQEVELEIDVKADFIDDDLNAYNTIAEIPGTDKKDEVVMVGAHLDSWHGGTGATDNAAGVAIMMEAMRILKALDVKPRRTIRIALWTGEEQGLDGAEAYVNKNFGYHKDPKDPQQRDLPSYLRTEWGELVTRPGHSKLSAYFNMDNGTGKVRGIYAQSNAAVVPIFESWLEPLHDLGATTVTSRDTGATDHVPFDRAGLPAFQFIQDEIDYTAKTHHSNMDTFDHLEPADLKQAAVVVANFLYDTAMRNEKLPRKALPK